MIVNANALHIPLADRSVQTAVTSPPYYGLRDYGIAGQIGLEQTPEAYVANLVAVFREVKRVLRDDGTLWLNLGDSYAGGNQTGRNDNGRPEKGRGWAEYDIQRTKITRSDGLKPKDLIGIPWLVAKALQEPYYTGRIKAERDRVWLAATIDAEGTICGFTHVRKDNGDTRRGIHLTITNSNVAMLDEAYRIWKTSRQDHNAHGVGHLGKLDTYRWIAHDVEEKQQLLAELYPYFVCKKTQALLAWNFLEISKQARGRNKGKEGDDNREKSAWIVSALSKLNHLESIDIPSWIKEPPSMYEPGWYLRSDIIWAKPNPMPESVTDRPTKAHEYLFLLTKSPRYYFDADAVKEPAVNGDPTQPRGSNGVVGQVNGGRRKQDEVGKRQYTGFNARWDSMDEPLTTRNIRTVWTIATQPTSYAHFATFPEKLVEPCIKAGTSERGCCPKCGKPWVRVVEHNSSIPKRTGDWKATGQDHRNDIDRKGGFYDTKNLTVGWQPACACDAGEPVPCVVFDPFAGSGTVERVAIRLRRRSVGTELNYQYISDIVSKRTADIQPTMIA